MQKILAFVKARPYSLVLAGVVLLVALTISVLGILGYRMGPGLSIMKAGTLTLNGLSRGAIVYVDEALSGTAEGTTFHVDLLPGSHNIIVSEGENQPWNELVNIVPNTETTVTPIFIPKKADLTRLSKTDTASALLLVRSLALPSKAKPLSTNNGCVLVYSDQNRIIAEAATSSAGCVPPPYLCQNGSCNPTIVFSEHNPLTGIVAFPGRTDALVVSSTNRSFVLEIDPRAPQFFAPLQQAPDMHVIPWTGNSVVITSGTDAGELSF